MELSLGRSRSGLPTCSARGMRLHSDYDPAREARRFARAELGGAAPSHVVLIGPCLDYLSPALRELLPRARIISIQLSASFALLGAGSDPLADGIPKVYPDAAWHPGSGLGLEAFLDSELDEDAISGVAVLEWEPAARAFPAEAASARRAVSASLDRLSSSVATVKAFGRRWIANACASFILAAGALAPARAAQAVLVAAAGPSLRGSLLAAEKARDRFALVAVSSALACCRDLGLEPDLVVATDAGFWSRHHLYPLAGGGSAIAAPLTALPSSSLYGGSSLLLLDQGSFAEAELLGPLLGATCPASMPIRLPPHGTVSGTALHLAARLSDGPIVVAGLDLAVLGDREHASPHGFDALLSAAASRNTPLEGSLWSRSLEAAPTPLAEGPWRVSRSLAAYASALALDGAPLAGRLFRLGPSPVPLPGFESLDGRGLGELAASLRPAEGPLFEAFALPSSEERASELAWRLASWRSLAARASASLADGALPDSPLVRELLRSLDIVDYAAARRAVLAAGDPAPAARELARRSEAFLASLERRFIP